MRDDEKLKRVIDVGLDQYTMDFATAIVEADKNGDHMHFGDKDRAIAAFAQLWLNAAARLERVERVVEAARPFAHKLRRHFPPPDSWLADATCRAQMEMTISEWRRLDTLLDALAALGGKVP